MKDKYLTVTALTKYIKRKMDSDPHLRNIWLKGEISNFKHHSRGHMYLTLKDDQSRIQAVMFAGNNRSLKFKPENGMSVLIRGEISVFEAFGQYQLYIQQMEPDGIGALYLAYEQLKEKLHNKGYFNAEYKKPIPFYPKHIAIITSPTGAAVRDIISTIKRRYPIVQMTVIPVIVQGSNAAASIKHGIERANNTGLFDLLIVGRGGGSIEELWGFNEEIVAESIFRSSVPVISAVGHETDITISDYIADLRAPTPTGAAELAVPSQQELNERLMQIKSVLYRELDNILSSHHKHLKRMKQSYAFRYPEQLLRQKEQELDKYVDDIQKLLKNQMISKRKEYGNVMERFVRQHPEKQATGLKKQLNQLTNRQNVYITQIMKRNKRNLINNMDKLTLLNPLEVMKRGFAIPYTSEGKIIKSASEANKQDQITVNLSDGRLNCTVLDVEENK
ncbi:exodeoxyribonuclease VII large subunit [Virgibacillus oceani]